MEERNASNMSTIRNANRAMVLRCIRERPISRIDISKSISLSKSAVTMIINDFIQEGLVQEVGIFDSAAGRKPILLDICPTHRYAVGVNLHRKNVSVVLTDLKGQLIDVSACRTDRFSAPEETLRWIYDAAMAMIAGRGLEPSRCIGIGCSCPGPLDYQSGMVLTPPKFPLFHHFPLHDRLEALFHLPVVVENNAVLLANMEYYLDPVKQFRQSLFVVIMDGIGSAILSNGQIVRGSAGFAGELGHTSVDLHGPLCPCGNHGCLEQYVSLAALQQRFGFDSYEKVVDDAYSGKHYAQDILEFLAEYLASGIVNCINFLDIDAVILYGELNYRHEHLFARLNYYIQERSVVCRSHPIVLLPSRLNQNQAYCASVSRLLDAYFDLQLPGGI